MSKATEAQEPLAPNADYFPSIKELIFLKKYPDEKLAIEQLFRRRFGNTCPKCKRSDGYFNTTATWLQKGTLQHSICTKPVSPKAGTIFSKSHIPLLNWYEVIYLVLVTDGEISPKQVTRITGIKTLAAGRKMLASITDYLDMNGDQRTLSKSQISHVDKVDTDIITA